MSKKPTAFAAPKVKADAAKSFVAGAKTRAASTAVQRPVRITVDMPPALHRKLKIAALDRGQSMREVVLSLVEESLDSDA